MFKKNYTYLTLLCRGLGLVWLVDWPTIVLQCFDTVGWVIWPVKIVLDMTYNVLGGTLNPALLLLQLASEGQQPIWHCSTLIRWTGWILEMICVIMTAPSALSRVLLLLLLFDRKVEGYKMPLNWPLFVVWNCQNWMSCQLLWNFVKPSVFI